MDRWARVEGCAACPSATCTFPSARLSPAEARSATTISGFTAKAAENSV